MRRSTLLCLVAGLAVALPAAPLAADYTHRIGAGGEVILGVSGTISHLDGALFLHEVNRAGPDVIELEGPGGDFLSAVRMGVIIKARALATHAVGPCRSACAYVWMAGTRMLADAGAPIDIHLPEAIDENRDESTRPLRIALVGWYLGRLDLDAELMRDFLLEATDRDSVANRYFDMLDFARSWNAPVEIVTPAVGQTTLAAR